MQALDPPGVGARSVGECIELQLRQLDPETPGLNARDARSRGSTSSSSPSASCHCCAASFARPKRNSRVALALVRACHPRPGATVSTGAAEYVVPDVFVRRTDHGWSVEINAATLPRVRLNRATRACIGRNASHATMRAQLQEARWLLKSLEIRNETLMKVARSIVERQQAFLEHGEEHMRPMILKDIAEAIGDARIDDFARHLRQVHAHAARRVRAALFLFEPGRRRRRLRARRRRPSAPRSGSSSRKRMPKRR